MKNIIGILVLFCMSIQSAERVGIMFNDTTSEKTVVVTQKDWESANLKASQLDAEGKYQEASNQYIAVLNLAMSIKDGYTKSRSAWALNNAAYMLIKLHIKDKSGNVEQAKTFLLAAQKLEPVSADCVKCIESNLKYCLNHSK